MSVSLEREGGVVRLVLESPPANALDHELAVAIEDAAEDVEHDPDARVLVVHSRVDRFFMAGGDIKRYARLSTEELVEAVREYRRVFTRVHQLDLPTIGVANGYATGGGAELLLACDFRIVTRQAQIGLVEIQIGGLPSATGTQLATRLLGYTRAMELLLSGRMVGGEEAVEIGLATQLADGDGLAAAMDLARDVAEQPPIAVRWIKRCARAVVDRGLDAGLALEDDATRAVVATEEFQERVQAFVRRSEERRAER